MKIIVDLLLDLVIDKILCFLSTVAYEVMILAHGFIEGIVSADRVVYSEDGVDVGPIIVEEFGMSDSFFCVILAKIYASIFDD